MYDNEKAKRTIKILNIIITVLLCFTAVISFFGLFILPNISGLYDAIRPIPPLDASKNFITVFNVGEADSILVCSGGQKVLIDTGTSEYVNDLCADIHNLGIKQLDAVFISHLHDDHSGGINKITEKFTVKNLIIPNLLDSKEDAFNVKNAKNDVLNAGGRVYTAVQGMVINCGEFEITVLGYYQALSDENNRSVFIMIKYNDIKFLFTGDAEKEAEDSLIKDNINFDCDILKVAHHGSSTSTTADFLRIATPEYAVISCGEDNQYDHPSEAVLKRLSNADTKEIYRTDINGDITFHFYPDSDEINISVERMVEK